MAVGDFGPSAIEHILRFLKESGHRLQLFLLYYIFSVFSIAVFAKLFPTGPTENTTFGKEGAERQHIPVNCCLWFLWYTLTLILSSIFLEFNRISVNSKKIFPVSFKPFFYTGTAIFVCFCQKKRECVVKLFRIFVFFPQTRRFFYISYCTFSIKKGKKLRKSLAKRLQVCYNKCSTVKKLQNDFCRETVFLEWLFLL